MISNSASRWPRSPHRIERATILAPETPPALSVKFELWPTATCFKEPMSPLASEIMRMATTFGSTYPAISSRSGKRTTSIQEAAQPRHVSVKSATSMYRALDAKDGSRGLRLKGPFRVAGVHACPGPRGLPTPTHVESDTKFPGRFLRCVVSILGWRGQASMHRGKQREFIPILNDFDRHRQPCVRCGGRTNGFRENPSRAVA